MITYFRTCCSWDAVVKMILLLHNLLDKKVPTTRPIGARLCTCSLKLSVAMQ